MSSRCVGVVSSDSVFARKFFFVHVTIAVAALGVADAIAACDETCRRTSSLALQLIDTDGGQFADPEFENAANIQLLQSDLQMTRGPLPSNEAARNQQFPASRASVAGAASVEKKTAEAAVSSSAIDAEGVVRPASQGGQAEVVEEASPVVAEVLSDGTAAAPGAIDKMEASPKVESSARAASEPAAVADPAGQEANPVEGEETQQEEGAAAQVQREAEENVQAAALGAIDKMGASQKVESSAVAASEPAAVADPAGQEANPAEGEEDTQQEKGAAAQVQREAEEHVQAAAPGAIDKMEASQKVESLALAATEPAAVADPAGQEANPAEGEEGAAAQVQREAEEYFQEESTSTTVSSTTVRGAELTVDAEELAETSGMALNAEGDMVAFFGALLSNTLVVVVCILGFSHLRRKFPQIFMNNVRIGIAPMTPGEGFFDWILASRDTTTEEAAKAIGLDNAMMLEFTKLGMRITMRIGVPMLLLIGPMNCFFGGNAAGEDHLSYLSFGNVKDKSWLYWVHSFVVWYVVAVVQVSLYHAQPKFLTLRYAWLRTMPAVRAQTIFVENIPCELCSDDKLKEFFSNVIGAGRVKSASVVKDTSSLLPLVEERKAMEKNLKEAKFAADSKGAISKARGAPVANSVAFYQNELNRLSVAIKSERSAIQYRSKEVGDFNLSNGFVTFVSRRDAEIALRLDYMEDADVLQASTPPCTTDILWSGVQEPFRKQQAKTLIGLALTAGLYFGYLPIVLLVTNIAKLINMGPLQPLWQGLAPTMGLQFMVAFLPTFLIWIFRLCFSLKAAAWEQQKLQTWYFWFQLVFVVLATAVGQDLKALLDFTNMLVTDPTGIFTSLAKTMPYATHFYMNFIVLQWATHAMILTRYIPLSKYLALRNIFEEEDARALAEPEDQDYYGIGARSARWSILLVIAIVYGTLSPPINLLAFINFAVCRLVYGYLLPYAETRKPDLGGVFWMQMCKHIFYGNILYCVLMIGVFMVRAASWGPVIISAPSLGYVIWSMVRFDTAFSWERLPFTEVVKQGEISGYEFTHPGGDLKYVQPELVE